MRPHELLSDREYKIMRMLASGMALKDIGAELCVSPNSISTYRARVLKNLGLKSNAELARYCFEHKLED